MSATKTKTKKEGGTGTPRYHRAPGMSQRKNRVELEKKMLRVEVEEEHPTMSSRDVQALVDKLYKERFNTFDPALKYQFEKTAQEIFCPSRNNIVDKIEVAAIRELDEVKDLEALLTASTTGRPSSRTLPRAVFERFIFEKGKPEVKTVRQDFKEKAPVLDWAYGHPSMDGWSSLYDTLHAMLGRYSPEICMDVTMRIFLRLRRDLGIKDMGRYLAVDGTPILAPVEQSPTAGKHKDLIMDHRTSSGGRNLENAAFRTHGDSKSWVGYCHQYLIDIKSGHPIAYQLLPNGVNEADGLEALLLKAKKYWEKYSDEPWEPEYLVGDSAYDTEKVHRLLEERFGIHPVFPLKEPLGKKHKGKDRLFYENNGVPTCAGHKKDPSDPDVDMHPVTPKYFKGHAQRRQDGLELGEEADLSKAISIWECPVCKIRHTTKWHDDPRAYPFLPYKSANRHRLEKSAAGHSALPSLPKRIALREALYLRRNVVESVNSRLKHRGIGAGGHNAPGWIRWDHEMEWLCYGVSMTFTLAALAHHVGLYTEAETEAKMRKIPF